MFTLTNNQGNAGLDSCFFFLLTSSACHKQCLTSGGHGLGNADFCVLLGRVFSGKLWKIKLTCIQPCNCSSCTSRYLTHAYKRDRQRDVTMSIKATQKQPKYHSDSLCSLYYRNTPHLWKFPKSPQLWQKSKLKLFFFKKTESCISQAVSDSLYIFTIYI